MIFLKVKLEATPDSQENQKFMICCYLCQYAGGVEQHDQQTWNDHDAHTELEDELSVPLFVTPDFIGHLFKSDDADRQHRGKYCTDGHHYAVADKVEGVENIHVSVLRNEEERFDLGKYAVTEDGYSTDGNDFGNVDCDSFFAADV